MDSLQQNCPLPLHPFPPKNGGTGATPTRQKEQLSGYILILQDDYRKVTFLNCLTGLLLWVEWWSGRRLEVSITDTRNVLPELTRADLRILYL
jgi:hypothetical protein